MKKETTSYGVKMRELYFRAFDKAMQDANGQKSDPRFEKRLSLLEKYGKEAGLSSSDIDRRKKTVLSHLTHLSRK